MRSLVVICLLCLMHTIAIAQIPPKSLVSEKEVNAALFSIYANHHASFFCQQSFDHAGRFPRPDAKTIQTENKIDWIPLVSKKILAANRPCYEQKICINHQGQRYKGLNCCKRTDQLFNIMLYDLHNRLPVIHSIAKNIHTHRFDTISEPNESAIIYYPNCAFRVHSKQKIIEPNHQLKGEIARIYLYMQDTYHLSIQESQLELFKKWHQANPPSKWEKQKNRAIQKIQGNVNPYVERL